MHVRIVSLSLAALFIGSSTRAAEVVAKAELKDAAGKSVGTATFKDVKDGVEVSLQVSGLKAGKHGFHIHAVGKCEAPDFKSAGGHFNPHKKEHGLDNPKGAHGGDMPNLEIGADGKGKVTMVAKGISIAPGMHSLFGTDGTSIVIHADADDMKTDPAGNAGARIACGVIGK